MEKQKKSCLAHSFNMVFGDHIISGDAEISHIGQMENTLVCRNPQNLINQLGFYTRNKGNNNVVIRNHFLSKLSWNQDMNYSH